MSEVGDLENELGFIEDQINDLESQLGALQEQKSRCWSELQQARQAQDVDSNE